MVGRGGGTADALLAAEAVRPWLPWLAVLLVGWTALLAVLLLRPGASRDRMRLAGTGLKLFTVAFFVYLLVADGAGGQAIFGPGLRIALYFGIGAAAVQVAVRIGQLLGPGGPLALRP